MLYGEGITWMTTSRYLAHSANAAGRTHALKDCLASLAEKFFGDRAGAEEAALAGLLHDLGKYGDLFQKRLRGQAPGIDDWPEGASFSLLKSVPHHQKL